MFTVLILVVLALVLAGIGLAQLLQGKSLPSVPARFHFGERPPKSLFDSEVMPTSPGAATERRTLLDRAGEGDQATLAEAHALRDVSFYHAVLNALIERTSSSQPDFDSLVRHIGESSDLPVSANLAERVLERYRTGPERGWVAVTLHLAARTEDAAIFEKAVESILRLWSDGRTPEVSAEELCTLFESEYWVLGADARRAGPGFTLRQRLAEVRRQLAGAARPASVQQKQSLPAVNERTS